MSLFLTMVRVAVVTVVMAAVGFVQSLGVLPLVALAGNHREEKAGGDEEDRFHLGRGFSGSSPDGKHSLSPRGDNDPDQRPSTASNNRVRSGQKSSEGSRPLAIRAKVRRRPSGISRNPASVFTPDIAPSFERTLPPR